MSNKLYVVLSGKTITAPALPPAVLPLSREGVLVTTSLAEASFWPKVSIIYHSPELRAAQTGELIAQRWQVPLQMEEELEELWFAGLPSGEKDWERMVSEHLEGLGSSRLLEPYGEAARRIVDFVRKAADRHRGEDFAIVSHERIITVLFSTILGRRLGGEGWLSLRSPDLSVVNFSSWQVIAGFFSDFASSEGGEAGPSKNDDGFLKI